MGTERLQYATVATPVEVGQLLRWCYCQCPMATPMMSVEHSVLSERLSLSWMCISEQQAVCCGLFCTNAEVELVCADCKHAGGSQGR